MVLSVAWNMFSSLASSHRDYSAIVSLSGIFLASSFFQNVCRVWLHWCCRSSFAVDYYVLCVFLIVELFNYSWVTLSTRYVMVADVNLSFIHPLSVPWLHPSLYLLVSWAWWDWPLTWLTNRHPSVLWQCWLGRLTRKIVSKMTYNVPSGTLNPTIPYHNRGHISKTKQDRPIVTMEHY